MINWSQTYSSNGISSRRISSITLQAGSYCNTSIANEAASSSASPSSLLSVKGREWQTAYNADFDSTTWHNMSCCVGRGCILIVFTVIVHFQQQYVPAFNWLEKGKTCPVTSTTRLLSSLPRSVLPLLKACVFIMASTRNLDNLFICRVFSSERASWTVL